MRHWCPERQDFVVLSQFQVAPTVRVCDSRLISCVETLLCYLTSKFRPLHVCVTQDRLFDRGLLSVVGIRLLLALAVFTIHGKRCCACKADETVDTLHDAQSTSYMSGA